MKIFVLSDNTDTYAGMRLAGADGAVVHDRASLLARLEAVCADGGYGVVMVTQKLRRLADDVITAKMSSHSGPIFLEIPDRHGFGSRENSVADFIKTSIGLK